MDIASSLEAFEVRPMAIELAPVAVLFEPNAVAPLRVLAVAPVPIAVE
jgi:hypothetical protein